MTVFVDANRNGVLDATELRAYSNSNRLLDAGEVTVTTDSQGHYRFDGLAAGHDFEVTELLPDGWDVPEGFDVAQTVAIHDGAYRFDGIQDVNGNSVRESSDLLLQDWTVFVDANSNGIYDTGELQTKSLADGTYRITGITPGTINVVEVLQSGWRSSAPVTKCQ